MSDEDTAKRIKPCVCPFNAIPLIIQKFIHKIIVIMFFVFFIETDIRKYASVFTFLSETFAIKACIGIQKQTININMCFS